MNSIKTVTVNRKNKNSTDDELHNLSKEELIDRVKQLEAHNCQLKNIIQKLNNEKSCSTTKNSRTFDFSKAFKRHILLRFYYLGWDYQGYASQEDSTATIEYHLFQALMKTCLIENREASNYHRCGRTDKGVSAFHQVISIDVRSRYPVDQQLSPDSIKNEYNYCQMLNRVLPEDIRCIAWMPLKNCNYSARFDCNERTYRYLFPKGKLLVDKMRESCKLLEGVHDFRNLCKMDVANGVVSFVRNIKEADILVADDKYSIGEDSYQMLYLQITGQAFLWHQIRCIMAILLLIGQGYEEPDIIAELLNIEKNSRKPQYSLAHELPLNLFSVSFCGQTRESNEKNENVNIDDNISDQSDLTDWVYDEQNLSKVISELQSQWCLENIKATMMHEMLKEITRICKEKFENFQEIQKQCDNLIQGVRMKKYQKLLDRNKCESLENRIDHYVKKRRLGCTAETPSNF